MFVSLRGIVAYALLCCAIQLGDWRAHAENSQEAIIGQARASVVTIHQFGRNGEKAGVGSGFVIDPEDGIIATALHVIGEGRRFSVKTVSGDELEPTHILGWDRELDLALFRTQELNVPGITIGDSDNLLVGSTIIAIGAPQGLEDSVVRGVFSARRPIDGVEMLQLALPIEPGNSGGPLINEEGQAVGIVTLKSLVTPNLGFAIPISRLQGLLQMPDSIPIDRWETYSQIDRSRWAQVFEADWRRQSGAITVSGQGTNFGGRSLLLITEEFPERPLEIEVDVKLENEEGAAGLVFASDGADQHYGYYPSAQRLRLTRFSGPDVYSWDILDQSPSNAYNPNEWNTLRVRLSINGRIEGFVNETQTVSIKESQLQGTKIGLAKFRDTVASFRNFTVRTSDEIPNSDTFQAVRDWLLQLPPDAPSQALMEELSALGPNSELALTRSVDQLRLELDRLETIAEQVRQKSIRKQIAKELQKEPQQVDLAKVCLLLAKHDDASIDVDYYLSKIAKLAEEILLTLPDYASQAVRLEALIEFMFETQGFRGSRGDYYHAANSYFNRALDDREGLPITLSALFIEIGRRVFLDNLSGAPLPGHFMVSHDPNDGPRVWIDVFNGGGKLDENEMTAFVEDLSGVTPRTQSTYGATPAAILERMVRNLINVAAPEEQIPYLDLLITISPNDARARFDRSYLLIQEDEKEAAIADIEWILESNSPDFNLQRLRQFRDQLRLELN